MIPDEDLCKRFPAVLRKKLLDNEIELPDTAKFSYEKIYTYRAVNRLKDDCREISIEDFKSYYELKKKPKKARGKDEDFTKNPNYYGVSCSLKKEIVEQQMKFPNPKKKMSAGYVHCDGGPQDTNDQHVCWWLYEGADVSGFKIL